MIILLAAIIGAGLLSFPFALKHGGLIVGLFFIVLFGGLNYGTLQVLGEKSLIALKNSSSSDEEEVFKPECYEDLCRYYCGKNVYWFTIVMVVVGILGTLIAYILFIEQMGLPLCIYIGIVLFIFQ